MQIEQSLHGYADGHRLLAGSADLPRQAKYVMLGLSDMSGRSMVPGFEEYLTGYPLADTSLYAFARTWYAPEMERPGCVWTHTLLINKSDLGSIRNLDGLRQLFRRPLQGGGSNLDEYSLSLKYVERSHESTIAAWVEQHLVSALWGLYGAPDRPFFYPVEDARQLEDMILSLWSQQWPSLRFSFRFCTGAIGARESGGSTFDCQIIPLSSTREVRRGVPASNVVTSGDWTNPPESLGWLSVAVDDLVRGGEFRKFLCERASGEFDGRPAFAPLGDLFAIWEEVSQCKATSCLLETIGRRYTDGHDARMLKQAIAGEGFPLTRLLMPETSECDVLHAIATTEAVSAFDPETLEVEQRASHLWEKNREGAEALISSLIEADLNRIGERILLALIRRMSIEDALRYSNVPGLVATVIRMNPNAAKSVAVWRGKPDYQRELFDAATGGDVPDELQRSIVLAMLEAGSDAAAERSVRKFDGAIAVFTVMTWFDNSRYRSPWELFEGWRRALAPQTQIMLAWLADTAMVNEASASLIADLSNPHSPEVRHHGAEVWLKAVANPNSMAVANARVRLHAFLLAFAFDAPTERADELVAAAFETVHTALANGQLADDCWTWIDDYVPQLSVWRNWDRCERLRRGLVERFVANEWPIIQLIRCAPNSDTLRDLLKACNKVDGGNRLLKRIRNAVLDNEVQLDRQSREVVQWYA